MDMAHSNALSSKNLHSKPDFPANTLFFLARYVIANESLKDLGQDCNYRSRCVKYPPSLRVETVYVVAELAYHQCWRSVAVWRILLPRPGEYLHPD